MKNIIKIMDSHAVECFEYHKCTHFIWQAFAENDVLNAHNMHAFTYIQMSECNKIAELLRRHGKSTHRNRVRPYMRSIQWIAKNTHIGNKMKVLWDAKKRILLLSLFIFQHHILLLLFQFSIIIIIVRMSEFSPSFFVSTWY